MKTHFKIIGFDADDTMWVNEPYYRDTEDRLYTLLSDYGTPEYLEKELYRIEIQNIKLYGYGAKGFMLSMIETALDVSANKISQEIVRQIIAMGHELIQKPIVLLDGIEYTLKALNGNYRLIIATKGDLLDQQRKLKNSGLEKYFHHIEIMSDKTEKDYQKLLSHLDINAEDFLMIGNSMKSDIIPVLSLGGYAIQVPCDTNWIHEDVEGPKESERFRKLDAVSEVIGLLNLEE